MQQDAVVQSGKAFVGISAPDITASAINKGADLIDHRRAVPEEPLLRDEPGQTSPIKTPEDMIGKKIGVQATNEPVWNAFLKANDIDPSKITKVPVQFDPQPLVNGEVDGWFSFVTNEPNLLKVQGVDTVNFLLADYELPARLARSTWCRPTSLKDDRDKLKAVPDGRHQGLARLAQGPGPRRQARGQRSTARTCGLDVEEQTLESKAQNNADPHRPTRRRTACSRSPTS